MISVQYTVKLYYIKYTILNVQKRMYKKCTNRIIKCDNKDLGMQKKRNNDSRTLSFIHEVLLRCEVRLERGVI